MVALSWPKIFLPTMEAECNALLSLYNFQFKIKEKQLQLISSVLKQQDTFAVLPTGYGKSTCYVLPPLILEKVKINIVQFMDQFPIMSMSTSFHDILNNEPLLDYDVSFPKCPGKGSLSEKKYSCRRQRILVRGNSL